MVHPRIGPAVRREVVALCQVGHRLGLIKDGRGAYSRPAGVSREAFGRAQAKAVAHELETLGALLSRLEQLTAPPKALKPTLPGPGTVARKVLEVLETDGRAHDHDHLRMLTGLTDAELAVRIVGVGPNSVRPRRIDLVRRGLVELVPGTGPECEDGTPARWRTTVLAMALLMNAGQVHRG